MNDSRRSVGGGIVLIVSGGVIVVGSFLDWFTISTGVIGFQGGRVPAAYSGIEAGGLGMAALIAGASIAVAGVVLLATRSTRAAWVVTIVAGLVAVGIGAYELTQLDSAFVDVAASNAANNKLPAEKITDLLTRLIDSGQVNVDPGMGLYLVLAGGVAALILGAVGIFQADRGAHAPASSAKAYEAPRFLVPGDPESPGGGTSPSLGPDGL